LTILKLMDKLLWFFFIFILNFKLFSFLKDGRFRLRYLNKNCVPIASDIPEIDEHLIVVDLVNAEVSFLFFYPDG